MEDTAAIVCRNLAKRFGEIEALRNVSLWSPYITFELHRTIPFPKASEIVLTALKARAGRA
mgnify:CR=1 FL=1